MRHNDAVVIGLGTTGGSAVDELARFAADAYGNLDAYGLSLLTVSFAERLPAPSVQHLAITATLRDWLEDKARAKSAAALSGWFDADYYSVNRPERHDPNCERQIARALFIRSLLQNKGAQVDTFLRTGLSRSSASAANSPLTGHILLSMDEGIEAILLDLINAIYRVLATLGREIRLIVHLALPSTQSVGGARGRGTVDETLTWASVYASLRELERFTISYGSVQHIVYPQNSGLETLNASTGLMIYALKLYPHDDTLASNWVDILLPQLDHHPEGYGTQYLQSNIVNLPSWRDQQQARFQARRAMEPTSANAPKSDLYAGNYRARSAIFPSAYLRDYWARRLSASVYEDWLGSPPTAEAADKIIGDSWLDRIVEWGGQDTLSCPQMVRWLLAPSNTTVVNNLTLEECRRILYEREGGTLVSRLSPRQQDALLWLPTAEQWGRARGDSLAAAVEQALGQRVILPNLDGASLQASPYYEALRTLAEFQTTRFQRTLLAFINTLLQSLGIRGTLHLLQVSLDAPISKMVERLGQAVQRRQQDLKTDQLGDSLRWAAIRASEGRSLIERNRPELRQYAETVLNITRNLQGFVALYTLEQTARHWRDIVRSHISALESWRGLLWEGDESVAEQVARRITALSLPNSAHRLWLFDDQWAQDRYEQIRASIAPRLQASWQWEYEDERGWQLRIAEEVEIENAPMVRVGSLTPSDDHHLRLLLDRSWHSTVATFMDTIALDLWADFLQMDERYRTLLPKLEAFFSEGGEPLAEDAFLHDEFLTAPATLGNHDDRLLEPLKQQLKARNLPIANDLYFSHDRSRIVRYIADEMFPVFQMPVYLQASKAYAALSRQKRARLHVMVAEVEATQWEGHAQDATLGQAVQFSHSIVALLINPAALREFARLEALGFVTVAVYGDNNSRYRLRLPHLQSEWWLGNPAPTPKRLAAVADYVFQSSRSLKGKAIPPPTLEQINTAIGAELERRLRLRQEALTPYSLQSLVDLMQRVSRQTRYNDSLIIAEEVDALAHYQEKLLGECLPDDASDECALSRLLGLFAQDSYSLQRETLQSRVH